MVYVGEMEPVYQPVAPFEAHWEAGTGTLLEEAASDDIESLIRWGRERAPVVYVRTMTSGYYSAGERNPDGWKPWPGLAAAHAENPAYEGEVE